MGEPAKIWRDEKLSGTDVYDDKIVSEFKKAKVMISVLSLLHQAGMQSRVERIL